MVVSAVQLMMIRLFVFVEMLLLCYILSIVNNNDGNNVEGLAAFGCDCRLPELGGWELRR